MLRLISLVIIFCVLPTQSEAAPVWKVTKSGNTVFIGGTVHILSQEDFPLPSAFEHAYRQSARLMFETDISVFNSPEFQQLSLQYMLLQDGKTLSDVLSEETYAALSAHLAVRNIPMEHVESFTPGFLTVTLSLLELRMLGVTSQGVDAFYEQQARADSKTIMWLEEPEQQLQFLSEIGKGNEDEVITHTLNDIRSLKSYMSVLMDAWRRGNRDDLIQVGIKDMQENYPQIYQRLIVDRNQAWMPKIKALFNDSEIEFVLVGALHLVGKDGVLTQLVKSGYHVEQLDL